MDEKNRNTTTNDSEESPQKPSRREYKLMRIKNRLVLLNLWFSIKKIIIILYIWNFLGRRTPSAEPSDKGEKKSKRRSRSHSQSRSSSPSAGRNRRRRSRSRSPDRRWGGRYENYEKYLLFIIIQLNYLLMLSWLFFFLVQKRFNRGGQRDFHNRRRRSPSPRSPYRGRNRNNRRSSSYDRYRRNSRDHSTSQEIIQQAPPAPNFQNYQAPCPDYSVGQQFAPPFGSYEYAYVIFVHTYFLISFKFLFISCGIFFWLGLWCKWFHHRRFPHTHHHWHKIMRPGMLTIFRHLQ